MENVAQISQNFVLLLSNPHISANSKIFCFKGIFNQIKVVFLSRCCFFFLFGRLQKDSMHLVRMVRRFCQILEPFVPHKSESLPTQSS